MDKKTITVNAIYVGKLAHVRVRGAGNFKKDKATEAVVSDLSELRRDDFIVYSAFSENSDGDIIAKLIWHGPREAKKKEAAKAEAAAKAEKATPPVKKEPPKEGGHFKGRG